MAKLFIKYELTMKGLNENSFDKFRGDILGMDISKNVVGGYGDEGTQTQYTTCTDAYLFLHGPYVDIDYWGDFVTSC